MIGFLLSPLARYLGIALAVAGALWWVYSEGKATGAASVRAEIEANNRRRLDRAILADQDAARCAADPACRLQSDGFRRE